MRGVGDECVEFGAIGVCGEAGVGGGASCVATQKADKGAQLGLCSERR